ncbi:MAG: phosphate ABC transporter permease PstA [Bacteriovoracaceae bacterium]|nr:phosphate ABC transporter permease PstA [Bacteriovoracaceae bacterium]
MSSFKSTELLKSKVSKQKWVESILLVTTFALFIPVAAIFLILLIKGYPAINLNFIFAGPSNGMTEGGIFPAIVGTFWLIFLSLFFTCPLGILAALYLNEYARDNTFTRIINLAIINLAGVPSIVYSLFGLGAFVLFLKMGTSILSASLTLSVMNLPVIITSTRESLLAVPKSFREACWNVGASKWQTLWYVVLPNSLPGILTGVIFSVSRAAGETAAILFTGVAFYLPFLPESIFDQCMALSMHLYTISTQVVGVPESYTFGTALVLIGLVLIVNTLSIVVRSYYRSHRKW